MLLIHFILSFLCYISEADTYLQKGGISYFGLVRYIIKRLGQINYQESMITNIQFQHFAALQGDRHDGNCMGTDSI